MGVSSLARVMSGWTGTITLTDSANSVEITITPYTRESVASLIARLVYERAVRGLTLTVSVSATGIITIDAGNWDPFDIVFTGNVATRTGYTGTYTAATTFVAAVAFEGMLFASSYGMRLADPLIATGRGGAVADGSGGSAGPSVSGTSSLVVWSASMTVPALGYDFDLWHDGRLQGRFCVKGVVRRPLSRTVRSADTIKLDLDVEEVA